MISAPQKFAILSDIYGERKDVPTVKMSHAFMPASKNVFLQYGMVRTMPGRADSFLDDDGNKTQTPDGNPIIRYHRHISVAGIEYEFAFTKDHIYYWNSTNKDYTLYHTCASSCTLWDSVSGDGKVIATNGIDKVLVWDETTPGTIFAPLGSESGLDLDGGTTYLTTAKYCIIFESYLWLGFTTEGGETFSKRCRWSTYEDFADFDETGTGGTGVKDFIDGSDCIKGFGKYTYQGAKILVIFKDESVYQAYLVEGQEIWNTGGTEGSMGLLATHSVVNDKEGNLYYVASDYTIRKFLSGEISKFLDPVIKGININYEDYIEAVFINLYNQIWWSIPSSASSSGNDKIISYNLEYGIWNTYDFAIRAFGRYSAQGSYTIDELDNYVDTIDDIDSVLSYIDYVEQMEGYPLDLGSDYSGYTYALHNSETDMGSDMEHEFVLSTDLNEKKTVSDYKRFNLVRPMLKAQQSDNSIVFSVKTEIDENYTNIGDMSIQSNLDIIEENLSCDIRGKHFLFRGYSTNRFDFIGLFFPEFEFDGDD